MRAALDDAESGRDVEVPVLGRALPDVPTAARGPVHDRETRARLAEGVVVCMPGFEDSDHWRAAELLARLTGREALPLSRLPVATADASLEAPTVTLVGPPEAFTSVELASIDERLAVGVLTAGSFASFSRLVARTLYAAFSPRDTDRIVRIWDAADPVLQERYEVVRARRRVADAALRERAALASFILEGRECALELRDGNICARDDLPSPTLASGPPRRRASGLTSCLQGAGCYRPGLGYSHLLSASTVDADVWFVDTCAGLAVGDSQFPEVLNLAVRAIDARALAFVGSIWSKRLVSWGAPLFESLLASGLPLGLAVRELNRCLEFNGVEVGTFTLLGDAALTPFPHAERSRSSLERVAAATVDGSTVLDLGAGRCRLLELPSTSSGTEPTLDSAQHGSIVPRDEHAVYVFSAHADDRVRVRWQEAPAPQRVRELGTILARMRAWRHVGIESATDALGALEDAHAAVSRAILTGADRGERRAVWTEQARLEAAIDDVHARAAAEIAQRVASNGYSFTDEYLELSFVKRSERGECPNCGSPETRVFTLEHGFLPQWAIEYWNCPRCGRVYEAPAKSDIVLSLTGPDRVAVDSRIAQLAKIENCGSTDCAGYVAFALSHGEAYGCSVADSAPFTVKRGAAAAIEFSGVLGAAVVPDMHRVRAAVVARGEFWFFSRHIWLEARDAPSTPESASAPLKREQSAAGE